MRARQRRDTAARARTWFLRVWVWRVALPPPRGSSVPFSSIGSKCSRCALRAKGKECVGGRGESARGLLQSEERSQNRSIRPPDSIWPRAYQHRHQILVQLFYSALVTASPATLLTRRAQLLSVPMTDQWNIFLMDVREFSRKAQFESRHH